jgi:hypothetical protein
VPGVNIETGLGQAILTVDHILERRFEHRLAVWEGLRSELEAAAVAINALERAYVALLVEIEDILRSLEPSVERIEDVVKQVHAFLHNSGLLDRLEQLAGVVEGAALHPGLQHTIAPRTSSIRTAVGGMSRQSTQTSLPRSDMPWANRRTKA